MAKVSTICEFCNKEFETTEYILGIGKGKYCSRVCSNKSKIGNKLSAETKNKISENNIGKHAMSEKHKEIVRICNTGKKLTEETKNKIRIKRSLQVNTNKGQRWQLSHETKVKMKGKNKGIKNNKWLGDKVGYNGLHSWIRRMKGVANKCELCGLDKKPKGMKRYFQWANISGEYKRDLDDFMQLCIPCHKQFDK